MRKSLRGLILLVVLIASVLANGSTTIAGAPARDIPVRPITPAVISWE